MPADEQLPTRRAAGLAIVVFSAAALLSLKTALDLLPQRDAFPSWFVPLFVTGLAGLVLCAAWVTRGIWRARRYARPAAGALGGMVWLFLVLSFVATSTVHQLYPFRALSSEDFLRLDPVLRFNLIVTGVGFAAAAGLAVLYQGGRSAGALLGLFVLDLLLLVPNDACANPFNVWWIARVGASPLMFVPNLYASLFGAGALLGVHPRWNLFCLIAACLGVALLGLGHSTRILW
ncbi:MAG TPA: hypothetical protein VKM72_27135 [Thermoanaerobaculia bacterium]|nr:hypothetical protein [Thermoanaerobaculia bacterium]